MFGSRTVRAFATLAVTSLLFTVGLAGTARADEEAFHQMTGRDLHAASPFKSAGNLLDHQGPVLNASHFYAIWWGPAASFPADHHTGLTDLLSNFGSSSYLQIAAQYMRGATLSSSFNGSFTDTSAPTTSPGTSSIQSEIAKVLNANGATPDPNGIYFVFTTNFPSHVNYCAWHDGVTVNGTKIAEAYMPNTSGIAGCDPGTLAGNNSYSQGTRSVANVTAHELMEAVTDPQPSSTPAWYDRQGAEIGDKCAWKFANVVAVGSTNWMLQEEWSNAVSRCVQQ